MRFFSSLRSTPSQGVSSSSSSSHPPRHSPSSSSSSECSCYSRYLHDKHTVQELVFLERHVDAFHLVSCMCEVYPLHLIHNDLDLIEVLYRFKTTDQVYRLLGQDECASNLLLSSRHLPSYVKKLSFSSSSSLTSSSPSTVATAGQRGGGGGEEEGGGRRRISGVRGEKKDTWGEAACCCDRLLKDQDRNFCQERKEKEEERKNARDRKERRNENERTASLISLPFVCENRRDRRVCPLQQYCSQEVKERKEKDHPKEEEEEERMCECVERLRKRREVRARREGGRSAAYEGRSKTTDEEKDSSTKKEKEREERRVDSKEEEEEEERWIRDILTPLKLSLYEEALSQSIHPLVTGKSPGPWHCAVDDGDGRVKIYVRNYQDNRELLTFRIEGQIEAPLLSILSVLNEVDLFKLWAWIAGGVRDVFRASRSGRPIPRRLPMALQ
ncbi:start-2 domain protein [Cystoisospora suis]|uniref:Start-2 domain protein n=1 Tax=Cystoisospora suis TaxID=483139 RepID=A0A2C6KSX9_9APIC|nr:start-2 domain protein [Cystoisospora suis]